MIAPDKAQRWGGIMAQVQRPERRTPQQWAALIREYEASGQSQRGFCAERGIGQSSLRSWRGRFGQDLRNKRAQTGTGARLVAVKVLAEAPERAGSGLVVLLPRGVRIEVGCDFDAQTLARVLATLEAA